jgi:hypothetical protein
VLNLQLVHVIEEFIVVEHEVYEDVCPAAGRWALETVLNRTSGRSCTKPL